MSSAGLSTTVLPQTSAGRELPRRDRDREVPRRDRADDADRHPHAHHELVAELGRRRLPEQAPALAAHVVAHVDRFLDVAAGLGLHLPHLARHQVGELVLVLARGAARSGRGSLPRSGAGTRRQSSHAASRGRDRAVDVGGARARERADAPRRWRGTSDSKVSPWPRRPTAADASSRSRRATDRRRPSRVRTSVGGNVPGMRARRRSRVIAPLGRAARPCRGGGRARRGGRRSPSRSGCPRSARRACRTARRRARAG